VATPSSANATAIWAAVAASFSAASAVLTWLIHRHNVRLSVRPELVLEGWSRGQEAEGQGSYDTVGFTAIRNVGRGAALNIVANADSTIEIKTGYSPTYFMSTAQIPILPAGEARPLDGKVLVLWGNVRAADTPKLLSIGVTLCLLDVAGVRFQTHYKLLAQELVASEQAGGVMIGSAEIANGVWLTQRYTTAQPLWVLRWRTRLGGARQRLSIVPLWCRSVRGLRKWSSGLLRWPGWQM
jgi:hypothetical protein